MATKQQYVDQGIDIRYQTQVASINTASKTVTTSTGIVERYDALVIATGFTYADPEVPGGDLGTLLRQEHSPGHGVGQDPRHGQERRSWTSPPRWAPRW